jgi:hypothetical protein
MVMLAQGDPVQASVVSRLMSQLARPVIPPNSRHHAKSQDGLTSERASMSGMGQERTGRGHPIYFAPQICCAAQRGPTGHLNWAGWPAPNLLARQAPFALA